MKKNKIPVIALLVGVGVLSLGLMSFGSAKKSQASAVFDNMKVSVSDIGSVKLRGLTTLSCNIDVTIANPTSQTFDISTAGIITAEGFSVFLQGKRIGYARINASGINIPKYGKHTIKNIAIEVEILELLKSLTAKNDTLDFIAMLTKKDELKQFIEQVKNDPMNPLKSLEIELDVSAFGSTILFREKIF